MNSSVTFDNGGFAVISPAKATESVAMFSSLEKCTIQKKNSLSHMHRVLNVDKIKN
jgi:hypothetical protein